MSTVLLRGRFPGERKVVTVELDRGRVKRVARGARCAVDFGGGEAVLASTLFDSQVNGAGGVCIQGAEVKVEDIRAVTNYLARYGVSHWVPTLVTGPLEEMEHGCRVVAEALCEKDLARAIPGVHLEGPCISKEDGPRGAHPVDFVRNPNLKDFDRLLRATEGKVLYTTVAPELPRACRYIAGVAARGVTVSLGHHGASAEQIAKAVAAGARLCTHLGNGTASCMHRHRNPLWPQLAEDRLWAGLIPDLHHLPPEVLKVMVRAKGPERVVLVSDCVDLTGLKPGEYTFQGAAVELKRDGMICLKGTDMFAGSSLHLLQGVLNAFQHTDMSLAEAFASATTIPMRLFGLRLPLGMPREGRRANLMVFEIQEERERLTPNLQAVFVDGKQATR